MFFWWEIYFVVSFEGILRTYYILNFLLNIKDAKRWVTVQINSPRNIVQRDEVHSLLITDYVYFAFVNWMVTISERNIAAD